MMASFHSARHGEAAPNHLSHQARCGIAFDDPAKRGGGSRPAGRYRMPRGAGGRAALRGRCGRKRRAPAVGCASRGGRRWRGGAGVLALGECALGPARGEGGEGGWASAGVCGTRNIPKPRGGRGKPVCAGAMPTLIVGDGYDESSSPPRGGVARGVAGACGGVRQAGAAAACRGAHQSNYDYECSTTGESPSPRNSELSSRGRQRAAAQGDVADAWWGGRAHLFFSFVFSRRS